MTRYFGVFLVALLAVGCSSAHEVFGPAPSTTTSSQTATPNALERVLRAYGVDLDRAPVGTTRLAGAHFCGAERNRNEPQRKINAAARRCFLEGNAAHRPVVFVLSQTSVEGDPIVTIYRSDDTGRIEVLIDATRDKFGSGKWERQHCNSVTTKFPDAQVPLPPYSFDATGCAEQPTN